MFKSKRSGLVRRLWRSRLVTESDGQDGSRRGEGGRRRHSGKIHRREQRSVTEPDPVPGLTGEAGDPTGSGERGEDEPPDGGQGAMCVPELRRCGPGQDRDSGTVTCCLFGEWDFRPRTPYWTPRKDAGGACPCAPTHAGLEDDLASTAHAFWKRLTERSLDALVKAVEAKGGSAGDCVMAPGTELRLGAHGTSPQTLLCRLYRWGDLPLTARLKALSHCRSFGAADSAKVCCNPYHYSRLCGPETPPPPYSPLRWDEQAPPDSSPAAAVSRLGSCPSDSADSGTSLGSSSGGHRSHWCSVAYWEHRTRVGRLYPAYEPSLSIFYDLPQATGLCLSQLHTDAYLSRRDRGLHSHGAAGSGAHHIRSKIGLGIVLSREPDGVWLYNRSQHPVFVHSATLDPPSTPGLSVKRVMPGFSLKVFDYERSSWIREHDVKPQSHEGPWDPHSVRISFAKGWGPCYSRQFITSCPCWLEVLLTTHR